MEDLSPSVAVSGGAAFGKYLGLVGVTGWGPSLIGLGSLQEETRERWSALHVHKKEVISAWQDGGLVQAHKGLRNEIYLVGTLILDSQPPAP